MSGLSLKKNPLPPFRTVVYNRPGLYLGEDEFTSLVQEIRDIAVSCFAHVPSYQAMVGTRGALSDKLISVARDENGMPAGFCSAVFLPVPDIGTVLHLGLTCVRPEARGSRLTHLLVKSALTRYLLRQNPFGRIWISNCAAVLSSLGNVAMNFENVFPSPFYNGPPCRIQLKIAEAIDSRFRDKMFIRPSAVLDRERFVFRGSVKETVFHKKKNEFAQHHRKKYLNRFYSGMMDFEQGDEVLQVGYFRLVSVLRYYVRHHRIKKLNHLEEQPAVGLS